MAGTLQAQDKTKHKAGFVTRDGVRLHYLDYGGSAAPLLFIHADNGNAHIYDDFAPLYTDLFHVIAMTTRGHGESSTPNTMTVDDVVDDIHALLDSLNIERTNLVAYSSGGAIITAFAAKYPARTIRLVYLDATTVDGKDATSAELEEWSRNYLAKKSSAGLTNSQRVEAAVSAEEQQTRATLKAALLADAASKPRLYRNIDATAYAIRANKTMKNSFFWLPKNDATADRRLTTLNNASIQGTRLFEQEIQHGMSEEMDGPPLMFISEGRRLSILLKTFLRLRTGGTLKSQ